MLNMVQIRANTFKISTIDSQGNISYGVDPHYIGEFLHLSNFKVMTCVFPIKMTNLAAVKYRPKSVPYSTSFNFIDIDALS